VTTSDLERVRTFIVPSVVANATDTALREAGARGHEAFVLWTGDMAGDKFFVQRAYLPNQTGHHLPDGICVTVDGDDLHRLNMWLYESGQRLGAQVHSHPTRAYHSDTDDAYPIATQRGALSLVVPHFATNGIRGRGVAVYRLTTFGWSRQSWWSARTLVRHQKPAGANGPSASEE
jgi:hypothetical protein